MSSQPIEDFTSGLICTGFVRGIIFSVRQRKKAMTNMKMIMKTPDQSVPKFLTLSRKLSFIHPAIGRGPAELQCGCEAGAGSTRRISASAARPTSSWCSVGSRVPSRRCSS